MKQINTIAIIALSFLFSAIAEAIVTTQQSSPTGLTILVAGTTIAANGSLTISTAPTAALTVIPNLFFNPGNGFIGIRTSSPTANLDVNGSVKFMGPVTLPEANFSGPVTVSSLTATGGSRLVGHVQSVGAATFASSASIQGAGLVLGHMQASGALTAASSASIQGAGLVLGHLQATGDLTAASSASIQGAGLVIGHLQAAGALTTASSATVQGVLRASGNLLVGSGGTPITVISTGSYMPTLTNGTNVAASTAYLSSYYRIGPIVTVMGAVDIDPTAAFVVNTELDISLPIASNFTASEDCSGVAGNTDSNGSFLHADTVQDRAEILFTSTGTANTAWSYSFHYIVK